ncbi:MAG: P1 family peptidase [Thermodesulfobacteriota bacterium]|nr:P1 family peptidase [Thermodesulfobacteriota bacterium]
MPGQRNDTITAISGVKVGHSTDLKGGTGLTVILFDRPAAGAVDITGMATSTRQIDSLGIMHPGLEVHAICFAGGSAFGLDAATGVSSFLEEGGVGLNLFVARVPVVPTAVIYDLSFMNAGARPTPSMAYSACLSASSRQVDQGCIGAGTGATSGKLRGVAGATKTGLGSSVVEGAGGIKAGALVVANPFGDILDEKGGIISGARDEGGFINSYESILSGEVRKHVGSPSNTTLCLVLTDVFMDKITAMQVARMAGHGLARHISPYNTQFDGDIVFCLSVGKKAAHPLHLGVIAAQAAKIALLNAVRYACPLGGIPASKDIEHRT